MPDEFLLLFIYQFALTLTLLRHLFQLVPMNKDAQVGSSLSSSIH